MNIIILATLYFFVISFLVSLETKKKCLKANSIITAINPSSFDRTRIAIQMSGECIELPRNDYFSNSQQLQRIKNTNRSE